MDRRSSFYYPRRSKPHSNYDDDDVVLAGAISDEEDDEGSDDVIDDDVNDEDYTTGAAVSRRRRSARPTRPPSKQRRLESCNYQFTPRSPEWSEKGTFVLLEIWGDRFLHLGRSSLRAEDWAEVADRVSDATRAKVSVSDCRNRMNVLKTRYKKERAKMEGLGNMGFGIGVSKWVYFKKMDALMTMSPRQLQQQEQCGLACGVDSGEFVFMNPRVYLDHSNALDEMRDSPGNSESEGEDDEEEDEESDGDESDDDGEEDEESYRMLSESIKRVGEIYEKIEGNKRQHMMELERMRAEFQRELELQKKEMIDRTRAELAKLGHGNGEEEDSGCSAENV